MFSRSELGADEASDFDGTDCASPGVDAPEDVPYGSLRCAFDCQEFLAELIELSGPCEMRSSLGATGVSERLSALGVGWTVLESLVTLGGSVERSVLCVSSGLVEVCESWRGPWDPGGPTANALAENSAAMTMNKREDFIEVLLSGSVDLKRASSEENRRD